MIENNSKDKTRVGEKNLDSYPKLLGERENEIKCTKMALWGFCFVQVLLFFCVVLFCCWFN